MTRDELIEKTISALSRLPDSKVQEVADFADFVLKAIEDQQLTQEAQKLTMDSNALRFLADEDDTYTLNDLKERYK